MFSIKQLELEMAQKQVSAWSTMPSSMKTYEVTLLYSQALDFLKSEQEYTIKELLNEAVNDLYFLHKFARDSFSGIHKKVISHREAQARYREGMLGQDAKFTRKIPLTKSEMNARYNESDKGKATRKNGNKKHYKSKKRSKEAKTSRWN